MPRKRRSKRRSTRGFNPAGHGSGYMGTAAKALSIAYGVKRLLNVEYKSKLSAPANTMTTTATITGLTLIAQGDDFGDRQGRKIRLVSLSVKGLVRADPTATQTRGRVMIIRDNNGSTIAPVIGDLFASQAAFYDGLHHLSDPQTNSRFSVLWDKQILLSDNFVDMVPLNYYKQIDSHCFFTGTGAADEGKGSLWIIVASNHATTVPIATFDVVVKFLDN